MAYKTADGTRAGVNQFRWTAGTATISRRELVGRHRSRCRSYGEAIDARRRGLPRGAVRRRGAVSGMGRARARCKRAPPGLWLSSDLSTTAGGTRNVTATLAWPARTVTPGPKQPRCLWPSGVRRFRPAGRSFSPGQTTAADFVTHHRRSNGRRGRDVFARLYPRGGHATGCRQHGARFILQRVARAGAGPDGRRCDAGGGERGRTSRSASRRPPGRRSGLYSPENGTAAGARRRDSREDGGLGSSRGTDRFGGDGPVRPAT